MWPSSISVLHVTSKFLNVHTLLDESLQVIFYIKVAVRILMSGIRPETAELIRCLGIIVSYDVGLLFVEIDRTTNFEKKKKSNR